ncbi:MAG: DUF917 domain-containing protein [Acidimicrobiales bacterium]|nr:DUF917 domain-containing protein [Hyphomonadaceae bacterium]RZV45106.1 MAG: DUF917 domain-containing protein [Acidimicrobiales bacterium]
MKINTHHLDDLALGSVFLATGGGGDPHIQQLITHQALKQYGPVDVIDPQSLPDDAYVVTVGCVGAPTVSLELLPSVDEAAQTLEAFEDHVGRTVDAVASFEIGGGNSMIPLVAAVGRGLPVIDGDGMGRALPEAQMMSYPIGGVRPTPAVAYDYAGNFATFSTDTTETYERHIRSFAMAAGGMVMTAEHPMTGRQLKDTVIPGTLSFTIELGRVIRENRGQADTLLEPLQEVFAPSIYGEVRQLFIGKVIDKATRIIGGYDIGEATIEAFDGEGPNLALNIKNEFLLAKLGGRVVASVPDLIVIVDYETSTPINAERLRYGHRVAVFAIGCPNFYRSEAALKVVAPRCFGFDIDYVPLEKLS